jgi:hypothetical protein
MNRSTAPKNRGWCFDQDETEGGCNPHVAVANLTIDAAPDGTFAIGRDTFPQFAHMHALGIHVQSDQVRIAHPVSVYVELSIPEAYIAFVDSVVPPPAIGLRYGFKGAYTTDIPNVVWIFANWTGIDELRGIVRHEAAYLAFARTHSAEEPAGHSGPLRGLRQRLRIRAS